MLIPFSVYKLKEAALTPSVENYKTDANYQGHKVDILVDEQLSEGLGIVR